MIQIRSWVDIADNTGARKATMIGVIGRKTNFARVGDVITANVKEAAPDGTVKKSEVVRAVVVRTRFPVRRAAGSSSAANGFCPQAMRGGTLHTETIAPQTAIQRRRRSDRPNDSTQPPCRPHLVTGGHSILGGAMLEGGRRAGRVSKEEPNLEPLPC